MDVKLDGTLRGCHTYINLEEDAPCSDANPNCFLGKKMVSQATVLILSTWTEGTKWFSFGLVGFVFHMAKLFLKERVSY